MKKAVCLALTLISPTLLADSDTTTTDPNRDNNELLKQIHKLGITHCDEFILQNTKVKGAWKFFMNKHSGGIDGPSTEVSMVQIYGQKGKTYKTDYSFIQTLKKCFLHKKGQITVEEPCNKAVDLNSWILHYELPNFDYRRYKNEKGIVLYTKDLSKNSCLLEYEFRTVGEHSIYRKIE